MGFLFVAIMAFIIGLALTIFGNKESRDWAELTGIMLLVSGGVLSFIMLASAATLPEDFAFQEARYNNLKMQIESCESDDIVTGENLRNQVLEMNNEISKHRFYSGNIWMGMWYSERIGNLKPLTWKGK